MRGRFGERNTPEGPPRPGPNVEPSFVTFHSSEALEAHLSSAPAWYATQASPSGPMAMEGLEPVAPSSSMCRKWVPGGGVDPLRAAQAGVGEVRVRDPRVRAWSGEGRAGEAERTPVSIGSGVLNEPAPFGRSRKTTSPSLVA